MGLPGLIGAREKRDKLAVMIGTGPVRDVPLWSGTIVDADKCARVKEWLAVDKAAEVTGPTEPSLPGNLAF